MFEQQIMFLNSIHNLNSNTEKNRTGNSKKTVKCIRLGGKTLYDLFMFM